MIWFERFSCSDMDLFLLLLLNTEDLQPIINKYSMQFYDRAMELMLYGGQGKLHLQCFE